MNRKRNRNSRDSFPSHQDHIRAATKSQQGKQQAKAITQVQIQTRAHYLAPHRNVQQPQAEVCLSPCKVRRASNDLPPKPRARFKRGGRREGMSITTRHEAQRSVPVPSLENPPKRKCPSAPSPKARRSVPVPAPRRRCQTAVRPPSSGLSRQPKRHPNRNISSSQAQIFRSCIYHCK